LSKKRADLDLTVAHPNGGTSYSLSFEDNVEMVDISSSDITSGSTYVVTVHPFTMRIPSSAVASYIYYAIAWTWVKDHAD
jgi:predicted urease superfamily metal-dependent hydrolase